MTNPPAARQILHEVFGYPEFRGRQLAGNRHHWQRQHQSGHRQKQHQAQRRIGHVSR